MYPCLLYPVLIVYTHIFKAQSGPSNPFIQIMQKDYTGAAGCVFSQSTGKSVFLFVFSCFGAHEIKVRGQYFFRLLTLPQYLCNFYVLSVITISEKISCFYFFCKSGQFYVQVVFMTIKKALPVSFRQSFPYSLKRRGFT